MLKKVFSDPHLIAFLWCAAASLSFWAFSYTRVQDSDLWWHLANGRWIWEHNSVPLTDSWSFTAYGKRWLNEAWLSGLIYYIWVKIGGLYSLAWWKWILATGTFLLLMLTIRRITGDWMPGYLAALFSVAIAAPFLDLRPQLYSLFCFVILIACTIDRPRPSAFLPLLFLLWGNLHAFVFFGLAALTILLVPAFIRGGLEERRKIIILWFCCLLACLINPNGLASMVRPFRYALSNTIFHSIREWLPPFEAGWVWTVSPLYPVAIAVFIASTTVIAYQSTRQKTYSRQISQIALGILTLAISLKSRRFIPLFAIAQSLTVASVLARFVAAVPLRQTVLPAALALLLGIVLMLPYPASLYAFPYLVQESNFPVEVCNFMEYNNLSGKVFSYYTFGSYIEYRTNGKMRVFLDGRADMVYDDETYRRYLMVLYQTEGWPAIIDASYADFVVWPRGRDAVIDRLISTGKWYILYEDSVSALLARIGMGGLNDLVQTPLSGWKEIAAGTGYMNSGEFSSAERQFRNSLTLMPHNEAACKGLADAQFLQGKADESRETLSGCFDFYPPPGMDNPVALVLSKLLPVRH